ncbi:beta-galactosidase [Bacteroides sp. AM16-24]|uniref:beta-galactosidase n=1 Tax=Bacteroides sp. AM16-24 TaxID=2292002 RepID=UPI000E54442C|nr:beta-galactosidase [Bacteroides sp. AM16-24]RHI02690.1 beta-galactosidase [Bacteroides sp. AM16-24]
MRNIFWSMTLVVACLFGAATAQAQKQVTANNAIVPGEVWNDTDGNPINAHGGGILYHEGTYYWYGEYKKGKTILPEWATWECYRTDVTGVSCYSSKDLLNWKFEGIVLPAVKDDQGHDLHTSKVLERPKVIYNPKTKKFVMWAHVESADYSKACAGVAVSDSPTGEFTYLGSFRPNNAMSRDQTVFVDDDGRAYHFYSSENNATLYISELTDDYQRPSGRYTRNFVKESREAPAVFKRNGKYYMLSSGCTGWDPNQAELAVADSIMGEWKTIGNPCTGTDADKTFYAQSTYVQKVMGKKDMYIAMFDRWNKKDLENSRYVWLPFSFEGDKITIPWRDKWSFDSFADQGRFEAGKGTFLLNGKPFVVKAAELHYPRIPKPYWDQRIKLCKALGMNTVCLYVFWNSHEPQPGVYDFTEQNDLAEFCRLCQQNDMYVILRPGPYVCAEWEMGGLPWWLLKKKDVRLRESDPYFIERVALFEEAVAKQVKDLTIANGGPIIMVQVENEYGSYGKDKGYVSQIRDIVRANFGNDITLFQCDWASNFTLNGLDDLIWTMNFGTGANVDQQFAKLKRLRPNSPLMCSEFWSGWFDKWGANHETRPAADMIKGIDDMLSRGISFSLYMTHGGTNWGHWAGANSPGFAPDVTSYDYDAPISESGQTTPKYWALREAMAKYMDGEKQAKVPALIKPISIPAFRFTEMAPLFENLPAAKKDENIRTMEEYNQGFGSILYRTTLPELKSPATLTVNDAHDYAQVFVDGKYIGKLDRRNGEKQLVLPACVKGSRLDILVEAMGRINFGRAIKDFKGITKNVELSMDINGYPFVCDLKNWEVFNIEDTYEFYQGMKFQPIESLTDRLGQRIPGVYRAKFQVKKPSDTFLNFETWGKGLVYVNGYALGRIWEIGPQQTLYVPGCWLKKGENEIVVFDIVGPKEAKSEGLSEPLLDQLLVQKPLTHRNEGENLNLSGEKPVFTGSFKPGNGWQEVKFNKPVTGRYVCIEALNSQDGKDLACIAEMYFLDKDGSRLSREPWIVKYADSEDVAHVNRSADKTFDLQESTYWSTEKGSPYPHTIVIDLGASHAVTGFQCLPRMESEVPGSIKDFKIYVKGENFKY